MSSRSSRRRSCAQRSLIQVAVFVVALVVALPVASNAQVGELESTYIVPPDPVVGESVTIHAVTTCSNPFDGPPTVQGDVVTYRAHYASLFPPCASGLPPLDTPALLGNLAAGTYTIQLHTYDGPGGDATQEIGTFTVFPQSTTSDPSTSSLRITVLPEQPTPADTIRIRLTGESDEGCGQPTSFVAAVNGHDIDLTVNFPLFPCHPLRGYRWSAETTVGPLQPGQYLARLVSSSDPPLASQVFRVSQSPVNDFALRGGRFDVLATYGAPPQTAHGSPVSDESGSFWFFDPANSELLVKVLDGRAINGHFWVFIGSMTDQPFAVTIVDSGAQPCGTAGAACPVKTYTNAAGRNGSIIDLEAF